MALDVPRVFRSFLEPDDRVFKGRRSPLHLNHSTSAEFTQLPRNTSPTDDDSP